MNPILDTFNGPQGELITDHVVDAGGPLVQQSATPGIAAYLTGDGYASGRVGGDCTYYYTARCPTAGYVLSFKTLTQSSDQTNSFGIVLSSNTSFGTYFQFSIKPLTGQMTFDNNGTVSTISNSPAINTPHTYSVTVEDVQAAGRRITVTLDGFIIATINNSAVTDAPLLMLFWSGSATPGNISEIGLVEVNTIIAPPTVATSYLSPQLGVFAQYTPATTSAMSALRFEYPARAIVLKGPYADAAVEYLVENTPPALVFQG